MSVAQTNLSSLAREDDIKDYLMRLDFSDLAIGLFLRVAELCLDDDSDPKTRSVRALHKWAVPMVTLTDYGQKKVSVCLSSMQDEGLIYRSERGTARKGQRFGWPPWHLTRDGYLLAVGGPQGLTKNDGSASISDQYPDVYRDFRAIDAALLHGIRSLDPELIGNRVHSTYYHMLNGLCAGQGISVPSLLDVIERRAYLRCVIESMPEPRLRIHIDSEAKTMTYQRETKGQISLLIEDVELLWNCNCDLNKTLDRSDDDFPCPIHSHPAGDEIAESMRNHIVDVRFDGMSTLWRSGREFWPPTIDSLVMANNMRKAQVYEGVESVLDVGCGTGFLSIWLARLNPAISSIAFSDWLLVPSFFSQLNLERQGFDSTVGHSYLGINSGWLKASTGNNAFDLLVSMPPQFPVFKGYERLGQLTTSNGSELLEHVVSQGPHLAERVVVQVSSMVLPDAQEAAGKAGHELHPIGTARNLAFRPTYDILEKATGYLDVLVDQKRLEVDQKRLFPYRHHVNTYEVI